jgi:glutamine synthetase
MSSSPLTSYTCLEYVWIDGSDLKTTKQVIEGIPFTRTGLRSKSKTVYHEVNEIKDVPKWNFDGSSTGQAEGTDSEVNLLPVALFNDPFRGGKHKLVMCACYDANWTRTKSNHRHLASIFFDQAPDQEPWFGLEQEYFLFTANGRPLGWHDDPYQIKDHYCGVGTHNVAGRSIVEKHYQLCLSAGIKISGINAEVTPGQWEFQVGPCLGIEAGDHLWMARYILNRVCEENGVICNFHPKPLNNPWNGSGCHVNFSTKKMRAHQTGYQHILSAIKKLESKHPEHMKIYGDDNHLRMTGDCETARFDKFTYGVANRGTSVRIGQETFQNQGGYFEDRRPASNIDPYRVTAKIFETVVFI